MSAGRPALVSLAVGAAGFGLAMGVGSWLGVAPDNDGWSRLAQALAPVSAATVSKPLEIWLAWSVAAAPLDPLVAWRVLGALHLGLLATLATRIALCLLPGASAAAVGVGLLALASPLVLEHGLAFNSVTTLAVALTGWVERHLAGSTRGRRLALLLVALSRPDGALLAALLGAAEPGLAPAGRRVRELLAQGALLASAALLWVLTDRVANGEWLGMLSAAERYDRARPPRPFGVLETLVWLRAAWLTHASEALLLLAGVGALALGLRRSSRVLVLALAGHHGILAGLALTGRSVFHRFFVPDLVLGTLLAAVGLWALVRAAPRPLSPGLRGAGAALVLLALGGYLGNLTHLASLGAEQRARRQTAQAGLACLAAWIDGPGRPTLVVPAPISGELAYRLRATRIRELTWTEEFFARPGALPPGPVVWLHDAAEEAPPVTRGLRLAEQAACPDPVLRVARLEAGARTAHRPE